MASNLSSEDTALNKQVLSTHSQKTEDLNVGPLLSIVEDVLRLSAPLSDDHKLLQTSKFSDTEIVKVLRIPINKISCEITSKCASGGEPHKVTMDLLKSLSKYSWDAKVVIASAGFATNYGGFWLVEHHHNKNRIAKNIATLKNLPNKTTVQSGELRKQFEVVVDFLTVALKLSHCLVQLQDLTPYISPDSPEIKAVTAHVPTAVYWILRGLLVCASTLLNLIGGGHQYITSTWVSSEIQNIALKLSDMLEPWQNTMKRCNELVERKKAEDAYIAFKRLFDTVHIDNMKVIRAFFRQTEDERPVYNGRTKTNEKVEALRLKYVLLLITDLDPPQQELLFLDLIQYSSNRTQYEIVWVPVVNTMTSLQETTFYSLQNKMPWYSAVHPSAIEAVAIRYIREELRFKHLPMLVVLDPQGKLCNKDALPMILVWGEKAFPFTRAWETNLWDECEWNIDLIADTIDYRIPEWINSNKVICLYGGDDVDWVRKFTRLARTAARALNVPLEMLYVGKRDPKEKVRRCHEVIAKENLSHIFGTDYYDFVCYFWMRLSAMWNSKKRIGRRVEDDHIMQEILDLLTYDSSEQGWAVFSRGNNEITMANGDKMVPVLDSYERWGDNVGVMGSFVHVLDHHLRDYPLSHHCHCLTLAGEEGDVPERVVCSECGRTMDRQVTYRCCTE